MKKIITFALACAAFLLQPEAHAQQTSASTKTTTNSPEVARLAGMLPGTWEWTESRFASRGVAPRVKTPETENAKVTINFRPDNLATLYINKKPAGTYQYMLSQPTNDYVMIKFKGNEGTSLPEYLQEGPLTITDNEILIAGGYNDAGQNVKFRKAGTQPTPAAPVAPVAPTGGTSVQPATPAPVTKPATKPAAKSKVTSQTKATEAKTKTKTKTEGK